MRIRVLRGSLRSVRRVAFLGVVTLATGAFAEQPEAVAPIVPKLEPNAEPMRPAPPEPTEGPPVLAVAQDDDRGPYFAKVLPLAYDREQIEAVVGRDLRFTIIVDHTSARPVTLRAVGLPEGATLDAELRQFTWRPKPSQIGTHHLRFVVSDGVRERSRTFIITVVANRPPRVTPLNLRVSVGGQLSQVLHARDPDGDDVTLRVSGLPKGAKFTPETKVLFWRPEEQDEGEHHFSIEVSDGAATAKHQGSIVVDPGRAGSRDEWKSFLLPGAGYSWYRPRAATDVEELRGLSLEVVLAAWIHRNDNRGPSHGRVYINAELLNTKQADVPLMFVYSGGFSLSLERNPTRSWLIPHYGVELGGIIHDTLGSHFQTTPYVGLHLYSDRNVFVGARAGYRLVPHRIDSLAGLALGLTANATVW